jgi:chromosome segregation ATPase
MLRDMDQITLRVSPSTKESLEDEADEAGESLSEYLRTLIRTRHDSDDRVSELEARTDALADERDQLREQRDELERDHAAARDRADRLEDEREDLRRRLDDADEQIESLRGDREKMIRLEARVEQLEDDVERLRSERDKWHARYNESNTKLKLHNSEKPGALARLWQSFRK